jgi:nitroreductase
MNAFDAIIGRKSIRKFEKKPVDDKLIGVILHMATHAPSAGNVQDWRFVVVKDEEQKKRLSNAALEQEQIVEAPVDIVVCSDLKSIGLKYGRRGEELYSIQDTAAAVENILLSSHALGLGACWVGSFDEEKARFILGLPEHVRPLAIVPVGYPAEQPQKPDRILFDNLTWVDKWGEKYEISYMIQPGVKRELKPIGNIIEEKVKKMKKGKAVTFEEFLRMLAE